MDAPPRFWLLASDGTRLIIDTRGLLIGRSPSCNLVLADRRSSKRQALIRLATHGVELLPLGRNPTLVNDEPCSAARVLAPGDRVGLPGVELTVVAEGNYRASEGQWVIERPNGVAVCPHRKTYSIGGGRDDDVHLPGWPAALLNVDHVQDVLIVTFGDDALVDGHPIPAGEMSPIESGATIEYDGKRLKLREVSGGVESTVVGWEAPIPTRIQLTMLPSGAELDVTFPDDSLHLRLSEHRARLILSLLRPRDPYTAGEFVPDDHILPGIWPGEPGRDRSDVNLLLYRIRKDLLKQGVNPFRLFERLKKGGATRVRVGPSTEVEIN